MTKSKFLRLETNIMEYEVKLKHYQEKGLDAQRRGFDKMVNYHASQVDMCRSFLESDQERYRLASIEKEYEQIEDYCDNCGMPDYVYDYGEHRYCQTCIDEH